MNLCLMLGVSRSGELAKSSCSVVRRFYARPLKRAL